MKLKAILINITILVLISSIIFMGSCRKEEPAVQETAGSQEEAEGNESGQAQEPASGEDESTETQAGDSSSQDTEEANNGGQAGEEPVQEETQEEIEIPEEITAKIEDADSLFAEGLYAEASQAYRNSQIAIEGSDLPEETKAELLAQIEYNHSQAKSIVDTARMHHSNAMTLIYEKRYEEAEAELNAALEIYPKYQTAIDALESLEDIKGLQ